MSALLQDGRLLVAGGERSGRSLAEVEIYDSASASFSAASPMRIARRGHAAVTLRDGRVLVIGGIAPRQPTPTVEVYDPASDRWSLVGALSDARTGATATLLDDGRVLIAGGQGANGVVSSLEIFDPSTNALSYAGTIAPGRVDHTASLLPDGKVLIVGGFDGTTVLNSAEVFDPATLSTYPVAGLLTARFAHSATTLLDGTVLVAGGSDGATDLASAEIYDPAIGFFAATEGSMAVARRGHAAFLLPRNNAVLIVGGTSGGAAVASAELFGPWAKTFRPAAPMHEPRTGAAGGALGEAGLLLVAGGDSRDGPLASAELYGFATLETDKDDYAPGETVKISGTGWQPGEQVTMVLHEDLVTPIHDDIVLVATADAYGNILNKEFAPDIHDLGLTFYLTATGSASQAQIRFKDSPIDGPAFNIVKNAGVPGGTADVAGEIVSYFITVANIGNQTLTGVVVTDPFVSDLMRITDVVGNNDALLDVGETWAYTASHTVTQADIDTNGGGDGLIYNTATAHSDQTTPDTDDASILVRRTRALALVKSATEASFSSAGQTLHYSYLVTNTGNVTLAGPVTVTDDKTTVSCPAGGLAPLASLVCTATYVTTLADVNAGLVTNHATAHANGTNSPAAMATVPAVQTPALTLVKSATETSYSAVGTTLHYSYLVTNTGNVTLAGPVTVSDDKTTVSCPAGGLAPAASLVCTASYVTTQADLDAGFVTNHATAHANGGIL